MSNRILELHAGGDHIRAAFQDAADIVVIADVRHIEHAIGLQREDIVDAVRRHHAGRPDPCQLARILVHLVLPVDPDADQIEIGMLDHMA